MRTDPLIFFVHTPKTAGTTVNVALRDCFPDGREHCEAIMYNAEVLAEHANRLTWMSAHGEATRSLAALEAATDRPIRLFSCMRTPTQQVMSHYNWLIEVHARGGVFYSSLNPRARDISEKVRSSPLTPEAIIENLDLFPDLFRNQQSRVILGRDRDRANLDLYEYVATGSRLDTLLTKMTGKAPERIRRRNKSRYHFDRAVFKSPEMVEFLKRWNKDDEDLHRAVKNYAW